MGIQKIKITNFKCYKECYEVTFQKGFNILVGRNEVGKSTILEAINLAFTGYYQGHSVKRDLTQYLFNKEAVDDYIKAIKHSNEIIALPKIEIEVYLDSLGDTSEFMGNGNSDKTDDAEGFIFCISYDDHYADSFKDLWKNRHVELTSLPLEYYDVKWVSFARKRITPRDIRIKCSLIDSSRPSYRSVSDVYVSRILTNSLNDNDKISLARERRKLSSMFSNSENVCEINSRLQEDKLMQEHHISLGVDVGSSSEWENALVALSNGIPFPFIGKGTQCILKTKMSIITNSEGSSGESNIILIEEPESHLSHGNLQKLLADIQKEAENKQIIISTHSSYVANRLGLENVTVLGGDHPLSFSQLSEDTYNYFKKLSGYDTLRYILSNKAILVEGPSDDLILQRAYYDQHKRYPSDDCIDVICVGCSFARFVEIALKLKKKTVLVMDNDGHPEKIHRKYGELIGSGGSHILLCYDRDVHCMCPELEKSLGDKFNFNTLEPRLLEVNGLEVMKNVLSPILHDRIIQVDELLRFMKREKTECALTIYESSIKIKYPQYIIDAITNV